MFRSASKVYSARQAQHVCKCWEPQHAGRPGCSTSRHVSVQRLRTGVVRLLEGLQLLGDGDPRALSHRPGARLEVAPPPPAPALAVPGRGPASAPAPVHALIALRAVSGCLPSRPSTCSTLRSPGLAAMLFVGGRLQLWLAPQPEALGCRAHPRQIRHAQPSPDLACPPLLLRALPPAGCQCPSGWGIRCAGSSHLEHLPAPCCTGAACCCSCPVRPCVTACQPTSIALQPPGPCSGSAQAAQAQAHCRLRPQGAARLLGQARPGRQPRAVESPEAEAPPQQEASNGAGPLVSEDDLTVGTQIQGKVVRPRPVPHQAAEVMQSCSCLTRQCSCQQAARATDQHSVRACQPQAQPE